MALACKCDRCQKFFSPQENNKVTKIVIIGMRQTFHK